MPSLILANLTNFLIKIHLLLLSDTLSESKSSVSIGQKRIELDVSKSMKYPYIFLNLIYLDILTKLFSVSHPDE